MVHESTPCASSSVSATRGFRNVESRVRSELTHRRPKDVLREFASTFVERLAVDALTRPAVLSNTQFDCWPYLEGIVSVMQAFFAIR
jgi:hypothetical protein